MALYECTFITRPDITQGDVNRYTEKFSGIISEQGGKVVKVENWGLRSLAYKIKKNKKGYYVHLGLDAPSAAINELNRNLKISEDVIRSLVVQVEAITEEPSAIMRQATANEAFASDEEPTFV